MGRKRISDKIEKALNDQMTREAFQAQVYLSYASWAEVNSYPGIATFLYKHAHEEREHMFKFLKYINGRGGETKIEAIQAPPANPKNIGDCLNKVLDHEIGNSTHIDNIVNLAHEEKDWATFNFGQYFVKEQIEEEALINNLLDKYSLASTDKSHNVNFYELDKDLSSASQEGTLPREETF
jgi:ferritin